MTTNRIINVFDLGPGDGGKGGVVHKYATEYDAHTILKVGGAQGSHGVTTDDKSFAFSQWGCGTFENIPTHITSRFVLSPDALLAEAKALQEVGVYDPWDLLTIDGGAICSTPYHGFASRTRELLHGKNPRGTIGSGVGQAYRRATSQPSLAFRAHELSHGDKDAIAVKMKAVRDNELELLRGFFVDNVLAVDREEFDKEVAMFSDDYFLDYVVDTYESLSHILPVTNEYTHLNGLLRIPGTAIIENSHGVLTDSVVGFNPHTSALRTLPQFNLEYFDYHKFSGEFINVGVHRAYSIRHGAGPLPTHDPSMNERLLPGSNKDENRYQGKVRVGPLDFVLLRYALDQCCKVDALAITWFDQVGLNGSWDICDSYRNWDHRVFESHNTINPILGGFSDTTYNFRIAEALVNVMPTIETISLPESLTEQSELCCKIVQDKLNVPVDLVSFGPRDRNKVLRGITNV